MIHKIRNISNFIEIKLRFKKWLKMAKIPRPSRPNAAPNYEEYPIFLYFLNKKIEIRNKEKETLGILGR